MTTTSPACIALPNSWQQVIAVQDGAAGTRTLYVDGAVVAQSKAAQAGNGTGAFWIGQGNADNEAFAGLMDEVRSTTGRSVPAMCRSFTATTCRRLP